MRYGEVRFVNKPVSRIVFGTANPIMFQAFRSVYEDAPDFDARLARAFQVFDDMYALGVNCFDCADHYGEEPLGEWLASRGLHDKVVLLSKGAHHNRWRKRVTDYDILHDAHNSLAKLKTKKLDIYMLHRDDPDLPVEPIVDVLNRLHDEDKIGAFGVSNWSLARIQEANDYAEKHHLTPFTVVSPNYGLAEQVADPWGGGCVSLAGEENAAARTWLQEQNMPVFAYSPLARGLFSGRVHSNQPETAKAVLDDAGMKGYYCARNIERLRRAESLAHEKNARVSQVALAYLFHAPNMVYPITTTASKAHMQENIDAMDIALTRAECAYLDLSDQ